MNKGSKFKVENTNNSIKLEDCIWKDGRNWKINKDKLTEFLNENSTNYTSYNNFCEIENICSTSTLSRRLGFNYLNSFDWDIKLNNPNLKKIYHNKDWLYQKYMVEGKDAEEIAKEIGASKRVLRKWLTEKNEFNQLYRIKNQKINYYERQVILAGLLGDGHIDRRERYPIYIESHAENQKDYLYWKYNNLKRLCNSKPVLVDKESVSFGNSDKKCNIQNQYRFITRSLYSLKPLRDMTILEILEELNPLIIAIWHLDDAYRNRSNWTLCVARFTNDEKSKAISIFRDKFNLDAYITSDDRYISFRAESSRKIDKMILDNIPNNLDVIQYKILDKGVDISGSNE